MMPFPGGIEGESNALLLLSAAAAILYGFMLDRAASWRRTAAKAIGPLLLAYLAFIQGGPALLVAALLFSSLGDAFLAYEDERAFLSGLASFLVAHLLYVVLFSGTGGGTALLVAEPWRLAAIVVVAAFCVWLVTRLWPALEAKLRGPVVVYGAAILAMGVAALALPAPMVIAGALLFIASDAILAVRKFLIAPASQHLEWTSVAVWVLYYLAQLLITLGVVLA